MMKKDKKINNQNSFSKAKNDDSKLFFKKLAHFSLDMKLKSIKMSSL
jgi:hypothetical protein